MKFKLARPIFSAEIEKIVRREMKKDKKGLPRASRENLRELADVSKVIAEKGLPEHLLCKKLPHNLGRGIFLKRDAKPILKGEVIASYAGELKIIPQNAPDDSAYAFDPVSGMHLKKEEQALYDKKNKYHPGRLYSLNLDAFKVGNFTRFINHSEKPNVVAQLMSIPANPYGLKVAPFEIVYMAKKTIKPGEQLLVCYEDGEKSYWGALKIKPYPVVAKTFQVDARGKLIQP